MGLTHKSTGVGVLLKDEFNIGVRSPQELVVALAGNPNTGKSTVFNSLTGLNQHTGNWPGKTVTNAQGRYRHCGRQHLLVDLPGTYSLLANSVEEEVARDFICFGKPDVTVVVVDATCLERNLNLVLQVLEITDKVVVCLNLIDEAKRKQISVNTQLLSQKLGVPVVATNARDGVGLGQLKDQVVGVAAGTVKTRQRQVVYGPELEPAIDLVASELATLTKDSINSRWLALRLLEGDSAIADTFKNYSGIELLNSVRLIEAMNHFYASTGMTADKLRDTIVSTLITEAENIAARTVTAFVDQRKSFDRKIDRVLTSKVFGIPVMLALLGGVFWLTIEGSNYPSEVLAAMFFGVEDWISSLTVWAYFPQWVHGILVLGIYRTLAWVVSVMLPPMAIFFPLFTLLEDLGYLPRVAFNLDHFFKKACAHGKQALTMCMGFGCNAAGVIACRIIDSPRERLIATITNNFVPCNGRFPILIAMAAIFIGGASGRFQSGLATLAVVGVIVTGVAVTLMVSRMLSRTILRGVPSSFTLEMPPYRKPQVGRVIVRSIFDRTLFVLGRAVMVAAPAGLIIWLMANISVGGVSLLSHGAALLQPLGWLMGLDGYILMAFLLGLPANEIIIPIVIMSYLATGSMLELDSIEALRELLVANGWTWLTAVNVMLLSLMHFPCGTTLLTIRKETQSLRWTWVSFWVPTITGIVVCIAVATLVRLAGLI